jgi:hypothetical protein
MQPLKMHPHEEKFINCCSHTPEASHEGFLIGPQCSFEGCQCDEQCALRILRLMLGQRHRLRLRRMTICNFPF